MRYVVTINNKNYEVEVEKGQANIIQVEDVAAQEAMQVAQNTAAVAPVQQPAASPAPQPEVKPAPAPSAAVAAGGGEQVKSPMPGSILDVRVTSCQTVKRG